MIKLIGRVSVTKLSGSVKFATGTVNLQDKEVTPSAAEQIVKPDPGYKGLSSVKVIGEDNLAAENIKYGVTVFNVVGTYQGAGGKTHELTVTPTGKDFSEYPYSGFDGINKVNVMGDENLAPENVRSGVTIYGVEGEYETPTTDIVVTPTGEEFTETPPNGKAFGSVTVEGDVNLEPQNIAAGVIIYGVEGTLTPGYSSNVPDEYQSYVEHALLLYTGDYANMAILEGYTYLSIVFLMDDFTVTSFDPTTTEFKASGWLSCSLNKFADTWDVTDWRNEASAGQNYVKNIRYSSVYWEYNGSIIWPVGMSGGAGGGGSTFETSAIGELWKPDHGYALSELIADLNSFAVGEIE